jgi:hypothetical protein
VSTGLLLSSLLTLSVVDASCCELLWEMRIDINIPLHGVDSLAADLVAANSLVNVGLEHQRHLVVSLLENYGYLTKLIFY